MLKDAQKDKEDASLATPPTRRVPGPSPASTAKKPAPKRQIAQSDEDDDEESEAEEEASEHVSDGDGEPSEAAKNNRLRRLCEKKT